MSKEIKVGRRKRAVARVILKPGTGEFIINKRDLATYFPVDLLQLKVNEPFEVLGISSSEFDITANVNGGGIKGQADAIRLGISRALVEMDEENRSPLKRAGLMTRDSRKVERKKFGLKKARKSEQFSKR
ncbi:MAG: 30S ribosomal protein S9 [Bacteroidia bacterium]|nr:30S ribosomal protein S9 [Bacteroidia bacterium]